MNLLIWYFHEQSIFNILTNFLKTDPDTWEMRKNYQKGFKTVNNLLAVNDLAEQKLN